MKKGDEVEMLLVTKNNLALETGDNIMLTLAGWDILCKQVVSRMLLHVEECGPEDSNWFHGSWTSSWNVKSNHQWEGGGEGEGGGGCQNIVMFSVTCKMQQNLSSVFYVPVFAF